MPHQVCHAHCPKGGGGTGAAVLVVLAVIIAAEVARPVVHAAEVALEIVLYVAAGLTGCCVLAAVAYAARRMRRRRMTRLALPAGTAQAVSAPRRAALEAPKPAVVQLPADTSRAAMMMHHSTDRGVEIRAGRRDGLAGDLGRSPWLSARQAARRNRSITSARP